MSGQCTIIVGSSAAGTSTLSASVSLTVSGVSLTRSLGDANSGYSAKPTTRWTVFPYTTLFRSTNAVGSPHTFTVTVEKNLGVGGGFVAAAGETVTSSLTGPGAITGGTRSEERRVGKEGRCRRVVGSAEKETVNEAESVSLREWGAPGNR